MKHMSKKFKIATNTSVEHLVFVLLVVISFLLLLDCPVHTMIRITLL